MFLYLRLAARNLLQAKRRTTLLSVALGLVSMLLVLLLALSQGITDTMVESSTLLASGHINVAGFFKVSPSGWAPLVTHAREVRKVVQQETPGLDYVIDRGRGWAKIVSETQSLQAGLAGINAKDETRLLHHLRPAAQQDYKKGGSSQVLGNVERIKEPRTMILFAGQARRLEVDVGDRVTITAEMPGGQTNTTDAEVVFVAKDLGLLSNFTVFVHKEVIQALGQLRPDTTGNVMVYLKDPATAEKAMEHLRTVLTAKGYRLMDHLGQPFFTKFELVGGEDWTGQKLDLTTWEDEVGLMRWALTALQSISFVLVAILVVMIVVGITNSMVIAVRERTQEIGTLRAIGMGKRRVALRFVVEAFVLGLFASTCGAVCGVLLAWGANLLEVHIGMAALRMVLMSDVLYLSIRLPQVLWAVGLFTLVTALAALWPSIRAARLQPVTAIHKLG